MKKSQKKFIEEAYLDDDVCQDYKDKIKKHFPKIIKKLTKQRLPEPGEYVEMIEFANGCQGDKGVYLVLPNDFSSAKGLYDSEKAFIIVTDGQTNRVNGKYKILNEREVLEHKVQEARKIADNIPGTNIEVSLNIRPSICSDALHFGMHRSHHCR